MSLITRSTATALTLLLFTAAPAHSESPDDRALVSGAALSATSTLTDTRFDVIDHRGDVVAAATSADDGIVTAVIAVASYATPSFDLGWSRGVTGVLWAFDTDLDGVTDYEVFLSYQVSGLRGTVYLGETDVRLCSAPVAESYPATSSYGVAFPSWCIGDPIAYRWTATFLYDSYSFGSDIDRVPNWGWSPIVFTSNTAVVTPPPSAPPTSAPPTTAPPTTAPPTTAPPSTTPPAAPGVDDDPGPSLVSMWPVRIYDSRPQGRRGAGSVTEIRLGRVNGLPDDVESIMVNVTVTDPVAPGYLTVFPCGSVMPEASNLNYLAGDIVPNAVLAKVSDSTTICVFTSTSTQIIVDATGYTPAGSTVRAIRPVRVLDTRADRRSGPNSTSRIRVTDAREVPADATAVMINLTAVDPRADGYATVYPCDRPRPGSSHLNFTTGRTTPNAVLAKISSRGEICVYTSAGTDVIVDVNATVGPQASLTAIDPTRLFDSRSGPHRRARSVTDIPLTGLGGVPADARALVLNVTATDPLGSGYVTVFPCGSTMPEASNLNLSAGRTTANAVLARPGADGSVCLYSSVATHLIVDIGAYDR